MARRFSELASSFVITMRPGIPTTVAPAGTSLTTTEFEPTRALSPMVIGPRILAPAPTTTFLPSVGWRLAFSQLVPPSVTPSYSVQSSIGKKYLERGARCRVALKDTANVFTDALKHK